MPAPDYGNEGAKLMVTGWLAGPDLPACLTVPALPVLPAAALPSRVYLSSCLSSCLCSVLCSDFLYYSCNQPTPTYLPALSCLAAPLSCLPAAPCRHQQRHGVDALGPGERPLRPRALHLRSRRAGVHLRGHQRVGSCAEGVLRTASTCRAYMRAAAARSPAKAIPNILRHGTPGEIPGGSPDCAFDPPMPQLAMHCSCVHPVQSGTPDNPRQMQRSGMGRQRWVVARMAGGGSWVEMARK